MKKNLLLAFALLVCTFSFAKKVKFSVDMDTVTVLSTGVHVMGDFQALIGCPVDFDASCTQLLQEASSTIYSVIVDIPAFQKYEYIFVNGDQSYEVESIPMESVAGYNFSQYRWIYIDSIANDTTDIGAVIFRQNAPAGLTLVRFKVDLHEEASISPAGVHVAGNFQGWDPSKIRLYSFGAGVYEIISFLPAGTYEFKYYNGNTTGDAETIPGPCSVNSSREIALSVDTILHDYITTYAVCFSGCAACVTTGVEENNFSDGITIYPNPATSQLAVSSRQLAIGRIEIYDNIGKVIFTELQTANCKLQTINVAALNSGIYFLRISDSENRLLAAQKLVIE
jgi:alpha-amylase